MAKSTKLVVEGVCGTSPKSNSAVGRLIEICKRIEPGKVVTRMRLAELAGVTFEAIKPHSTNPALAPYKVTVTRSTETCRAGTVLFGAAKSIKEARKIYGQDNHA